MYDVASSIFGVWSYDSYIIQGFESIHQWTKVFSEGFTLSLSNVVKQITMTVEDYYYRVYLQHKKKSNITLNFLWC